MVLVEKRAAIDKAEFSKRLEKHGRFLKNPKSGERLTLFNANLRGVQATEVDISGADLTGSVLENCSFWRTHFTSSIFEQGTFQNCIFDGSIFTSANLQGIKGRATSFKNADLTGGDLGPAVLNIGGDKQRSDLRGADFE